MKIVMVGGIFHRSEEQRSRLQPTTETMLADGFEGEGHNVLRLSPRNIRRGIVSALNPSVDVIHIHHPGLLTTVLSLIPAFPRLIYTPHRTNMPPKWIHAVGHRRMLRRADTIVTLSPLEQENAVQRWGVPKDRTVIIPNGFDAEMFPLVERETPSAGELWTLLFVGQLIEPKQPEVILEALDTPELANMHVRYVSHNPRLQGRLIREAERRNILDRVTFAGQLSGAELLEEYRGAHMLILPSKDLEALPSVISEAMFTGLPIIAGDVGGIRWQLNGLGACVKNIDGDSLRIEIVRMANEYGRALSRGRKASERARRLFAIDEMVRQHVDLYMPGSV